MDYKPFVKEEDVAALVQEALTASKLAMIVVGIKVAILFYGYHLWRRIRNDRLIAAKQIGEQEAFTQDKTDVNT
jgi:hypothetical protein